MSTLKEPRNPQHVALGSIGHQIWRDHKKSGGRKSTAQERRRLNRKVKKDAELGLTRRAYEDLQGKAIYVNPIVGESLFFLVDTYGRKMIRPELQQQQLAWDDQRLLLKLKQIKEAKWAPCQECKKDMPITQEHTSDRGGRITKTWWHLCLNKKCLHQRKIPDSETAKIKISVSLIKP
jgi:hypothetical protein